MMPDKIDLRRREMRAICKEYGLEGLPVLGRGCFAIVFNNGDTAIKLMADPMTYAAYSDEHVASSPHFCQVVRDYGIVGKCGDSYIYMLELERLESLDDHPQVYADIWPLIEKFRETRDTMVWHKFWTCDHEFLTDQAETGRYRKSLSNFMEQLSSFVKRFGATLDLHKGNFMVRPGRIPEIVFTDPVYDYDLFPE
jgi:hypothetical protein